MPSMRPVAIVAPIVAWDALFLYLFFCGCDTVDGRHPAPVDLIVYRVLYIPSQVRISSISSIGGVFCMQSADDVFYFLFPFKRWYAPWFCTWGYDKPSLWYTLANIAIAMIEKSCSRPRIDVFDLGGGFNLFGMLIPRRERCSISRPSLYPGNST